MSLKELQSTTRDLRKWLAKVRLEQVNFRLEMSRELQTFDGSDPIKKNVHDFIDKASNLIEHIQDSNEGLKTLSMSPPGLGTAVLDFLYVALSGKSDTELEKYRKKLNDLKSSLVRLRLRDAGRSMGIPGEAFENLCEQIVASYGLNSATKTYVQDLVDNIVSEEDPGPLLDELVENIGKDPVFSGKGPAPKLDKTKLSHFLDELKRKLAETIQKSSKVSPIQRDTINKRMQQVKSAQRVYSSALIYKFSEADYSKFINTLNEWKKLFNKREAEAKAFEKKIEMQVSTPKNKKESIDSAKYLEFFHNFLGEQNPISITIQLKNLSDSIDKIYKTLSNRRPAIDSTDKGGETHSKNPESAQIANKNQEAQNET